MIPAGDLFIATEAREIHLLDTLPSSDGPRRGKDIDKGKWLQRSVHNRLAMFFRPWLYFVYRYVFAWRS